MSPSGRVRRVGILGHVGRPSVRSGTGRLRRLLARRGCVVRVEERLAAELGLPGTPLAALGAWCQVLVALGGDGTALAGGRALAGRNGTLLPINFGGLGFLTVAESGEMEAAVRAALGGSWPVGRRGILRANVARGGRVIRRGAAMNDAVVKGAGGYAALHMRLGAFGHSLGRLVADGLIIASAAGSTAYSLSAGGPLLSPEVDAMVVTPVCAHSLGSRSLVVPPDADLTVSLMGSSDQCLLLFDGHDRIELAPRDVVRARLDRAAVRLFLNPDRPFARSLQSKLGWQGSARRSF